MVFFDGLLCFSVGSIGMFKSIFQFRNISLKLLLHAKSLSLSLGFLFKSSLHSINSLSEVLFGAKEFLILLSNAALNFLPDLGQFKLGSQDLVLLLLKGTLSLFKSCLELHFLSLQTLPDFVNFMDGAATFADLIHNVLDFIAQDLVFLANLIQLKDRFLISRLDSEEL